MHLPWILAVFLVVALHPCGGGGGGVVFLVFGFWLHPCGGGGGVVVGHRGNLQPDGGRGSFLSRD